MLRACLQVAVPSFLLVPHSQDSFFLSGLGFPVGESSPVHGHSIWAAGPNPDIQTPKILAHSFRRAKKKKKLSAEEQVQAGGYASTVHF